MFVLPQLESSRKLSEIKTLQEKIRVSTEEGKEKEEMYKELVMLPSRRESCSRITPGWSELRWTSPDA